MDRAFFRACLAHSKLTLAVTLGLSLLLGAGVFKLRQDTSPGAFLPRGHVSYDDKLFIDRTYNIHDSIVVAIEDRRNADVFNPDALAAVKQLSDFIGDLRGVESASVRSLATWRDIRGTADGMRIDALLDSVPTERALLDELRQRVGSFEMLRGLLVSEDGRVAYVIADVLPEADMVELFNAVRRHTQERVDGDRFRISLTGPPVIAGTFNIYINHDALLLNPVAVVITVGLLFLLFRSWAGILLPFVVVLPAVGCALGAMGHLGARFTPFSNAIPVVVLCVALSDAIHILGTYYEQRLRRPDDDVRRILEDLLVSLRRPISWTSITTAAGFLALKPTSPMVPVQEFGVAVAVGAMAEMFLSFFALVMVLDWLRPAVPEALVRRRAKHDRGQGLERAMLWLADFTARRPKLALAPLLVAAVLAAVGIGRIRPDYNLVEFFPEDSIVYRDHQHILERFPGTNFVDLHFDSGAVDGIFEPAFLRRVDALSKEIDGWREVGKDISLLPYLKRLHQAVNEDAPDAYRLADTPELNAQLFFLFSSSGDPSQIEDLVDTDNRSLHMRLFLGDPRFSVNRDFLNWLEGRVARDFDPRQCKIGGEAYVNHHWMRHIESSVLFSVGLMVVGMFVASWLLIGSLRAGVLIVLPVSMGILTTYGAMGLLDIPLGLATSIFASIALGVGVDYAIHYLFFYKEANSLSGSYALATRRTMTVTGKLILGNAATVASGFLVLLLADTVPPRQIGTFVAIGITISVAATLLALGVLTRVLKIAAAGAAATEESANAEAAA
jgi:hypothetical protein